MAHPGEVPIDRYVVLEHLSEGGMGAIYVGKKLGAGGFEMEVVLKQLLPEFTQQEEFIDLFLREAKLSATLDHANIIHTIDLVTAGGEYFIVMEYLPGGDLRTLLRKAKRRGKRFSAKAAIYITREVLSALSYAHAKRDFEGAPLRLIHRDVSPSNVLLSYSGEVKLTDFGIAKAATHTSLFYKVKGKIGYMSPEQAKSESLDHRSDLYSIAVCLYEALTGERLFVHAGLTTSADEIYSQPVPQVSRKVPGVPKELDAIMAKALAIDPDARFQTAGEFQEALMRLAHRTGLLMSAPELATELRDDCGPIDQWRDDEDDDDFGFAAKQGGTEVYSAADEDDDADDEPASIPPVIAEPISISAASKPTTHARPSRPSRPSKPPRATPVRPKTELGKLAGMELTSIISMIDLEAQSTNIGAQPLVDLEPAGLDPAGLDPASLDSGPRTFHHRGVPNAPRPPARVQPPSQPPPPPPMMMPVASPRSISRTMPAQPPPPGQQRNPSQPMQAMPSMPAQRGPSRTMTAQPAPPPAMHAMAHPQQQRPARRRPDEREMAPDARRRAPGRSITPWIVVVAILFLAGVAALLVALSGPSVPGK
jgi:eukaryotic-like serine/threonine-protein kinase